MTTSSAPLTTARPSLAHRPRVSTISGRTRLIAAAAGVAVVATAAFGASRLLAAPAVPTLRTQAVQRSTITQTIAISGSVNPSTTTNLSFGTNGEVAAELVSVGQNVNAGDVLAKLKDADQQAALQQAASNLAAAQAKYNTTSNGDDLIPLRASIDQAQQALDRLQTTYNSAKGNLDTYNGWAVSDRLAANQSYLAAQTTLSTLQSDLFTDIQYNDVRTATTTSNTLYQNLQQAQVPSTTLDQALTDLGAAISALKTQMAAADASRPDPQAFAAAQVTFNAALSRVQSAFDGLSAPLGTALTNANGIIASLNTASTKGAPSLDQTRADANLLTQQLTTAQQQIIAAKSKASALSTPLATIADAVTGTSFSNARNSLANAKQSLQTALDSRPSNLQSALSSVQSAQTSYDTAQNALADTVLKAPSTGQITAINSKVGETVSGTTAFMVLTGTSQLVLHGTIGEADVAALKLAQVATITVDAIGTDKRLTGKVTKIDPLATVSQGVPVYGVDVTLDVADPALRGGMTGSANVIIATARDVLVVPNTAIKTLGGRRGVQVMKDGETIDITDVAFGISNDSVTEVKSGLAEGDLVVLPTARTTTTTTTNQRGGQGVQFGGPGGAIGK